MLAEYTCAIKEAYDELDKQFNAIESDFAELATQNLGIACKYCIENFPGYACRTCEFKWRGMLVNDN